jgi:hypothetical protein
METTHFLVLLTAVAGLVAFYFSPFDVKVEEED